MAHVELLLYGEHNKHEEFKHVLNNWRYEVDGKIRCGHKQPYVSEVRHYDIRLPEKLVPDFLRDLEAYSGKELSQNLSGSTAGSWVFKVGMWILNKFTPLKSVEKDKGKKKYDLTRPYYVIHLGTMKDPMKNIDFSNGEKREVL